MELVNNIFWDEGRVSRQDRERILGQKGVVLWFTGLSGLSGSGKSTLASAVEQALNTLGKLTYKLDGDNLRHGLTKDLSFSCANRKGNIRRTGEVTKLMVDAGLIVLAAFISPLREDRGDLSQLLVGYLVNLAKLKIGRQRIEELLEMVETLKAKDLHDLLEIHEIRGRLYVCKVLIAYLEARKETRWLWVRHAAHRTYWNDFK